MIYEPSEDSYLLRKQVKKYSKNKSFLDIGAGSGIQSEEAIKSNAKKVLAVDINNESIKILKLKNIPSIKSDLFEKVKGKIVEGKAILESVEVTAKEGDRLLDDYIPNNFELHLISNDKLVGSSYDAENVCGVFTLERLG